MKMLSIKWENVKNVGGRYRHTRTGKYVSKAKAHAYMDRLDNITVGLGLMVYVTCVAYGLHGVLW